MHIFLSHRTEPMSNGFIKEINENKHKDFERFKIDFRF